VCRTFFGKYKSISESGYNAYREWTETGYQTGPAVSNKTEEKHRTPQQKMEGPNVPRGIMKRHYA